MNANEARDLVNKKKFDKTPVVEDNIMARVETIIMECASKGENFVNVPYTPELELFGFYFKDKGFKFKVNMNEYEMYPSTISISWYPRQEQVVEVQELDGFKVGDEVYIPSNPSIGVIQVLKSNGNIETKSGIKLKKGQYRKPVEEDRVFCERACIVRRLSMAHFDVLPLEDLKKIVQIINEAKTVESVNVTTG
jgi:hypothetical protein